MITLDGKDLAAVCRSGTGKPLAFTRWDEDVYNALGTSGCGGERVSGMVRVHHRAPESMPNPSTNELVCIEMVGIKNEEPRHPGVRHYTCDGLVYRVQGYTRDSNSWREHELQIVPVKEDLFSRSAGLLETDVVASNLILLMGCGSIGSSEGLLLVQSGVTRFILLDHDRLGVHNVMRTQGGLSQVGRYKTKNLAGILREKNPHVEVTTYEEKLTRENTEFVRGLVRQASLCISTTDEREGRLLLNRLCLQENKPLIIGGAYRRAYGGQVFRFRPGKTACYQCLVQILKKDSNPYPLAENQRAQYSDLPGPIEPGLSIDIEPISHMVAKLALQELLAGKATTLRSLDQDLEANWFMWLNRREAGTPYESLEPLGFGMEDMSILRWYGIRFDRNPACPVCGDYATAFANERGLTLSEADFHQFLRLNGLKELRHGC